VSAFSLLFHSRIYSLRIIRLHWMMRLTSEIVQRCQRRSLTNEYSSTARNCVIFAAQTTVFFNVLRRLDIRRQREISRKPTTRRKLCIAESYFVTLSKVRSATLANDCICMLKPENFCNEISLVHGAARAIIY